LLGAIPFNSSHASNDWQCRGSTGYFLPLSFDPVSFVSEYLT
jgi:hypothetical protein